MEKDLNKISRLSIKRKSGESIILVMKGAGGGDLLFKVSAYTEKRSSQTKLVFEATKDVSIYREEIYNDIIEEKGDIHDGLRKRGSGPRVTYKKSRTVAQPNNPASPPSPLPK